MEKKDCEVGSSRVKSWGGHSAGRTEERALRDDRGGLARWLEGRDEVRALREGMRASWDWRTRGASNCTGQTFHKRRSSSSKQNGSVRQQQKPERQREGRDIPFLSCVPVDLACPMERCPSFDGIPYPCTAGALQYLPMTQSRALCFLSVPPSSLSPAPQHREWGPAATFSRSGFWLLATLEFPDRGSIERHP